MYVRRIGTAAYLQEVGGGGLVVAAQGESGFTTSAGNLSLTAASSVFLSGANIYHRTAALGLVATFGHTTAPSMTFAETCTSVTYGQTQDVSAAGASWSIRAQQGASGFVGGDLTLGGGLGGTSGTNKCGDTIIELGTVVTAGTTGKLALKRAGTVVWTRITTHPVVIRALSLVLQAPAYTSVV